jgi:nucleotidyltransferase substrate binding protein (TIGR01987 family)
MSKYDNFCKALENLKKCREISEPYSIVEQTGIVALFDICFEQSWKTMKEILDYNGISEQKIGSPRIIIKTAYNARMINNEEKWLKLLNTRNILAHTYSDEAALEAIIHIKSDYLLLFEELKNEIDENWL